MKVRPREKKLNFPFKKVGDRGTYFARAKNRPFFQTVDPVQVFEPRLPDSDPDHLETAVAPSKVVPPSKTSFWRPSSQKMRGLQDFPEKERFSRPRTTMLENIDQPILTKTWSLHKSVQVSRFPRTMLAFSRTPLLHMNSGI